MQRLFDDSKVKPLLQDTKLCGTVKIYFGLSWLKRLVAGFRTPPLPPNAVCPHCGFTSKQVKHDAKKEEELPSNTLSSSRRVGQLLRKMLPFKTQARWVIAHYTLDQADSNLQ